MQRSIRIQFVNILILFDVTDYRLLYGNAPINVRPAGERGGKGKGFDMKFCPVRREFDNYGGPGGKSFETSLY